MTEIFLEHMKKYPEMEMSDAVKLAYQSVFGCAHFVNDRETCIRRIETELRESTELCETAAFEDIGSAWARFYLNSLAARTMMPEMIADMFIRSSHCLTGDTAELENTLKILESLARDGKTSFTAEALDTYVNEYMKSGHPAVSHSARYNELYRPHYRVVLKKYAEISELMCMISDVITKKGRCVVAVDGRSAAGKSTLAKLLEDTFDAAVIHMDDFFLPPELRTEQRYAEPGGNVHYERFNREVAPNLGGGQPFEYRVFDCGKMELGDGRKVAAGALTVVEGAYALNPNITASYDIKVFCDVDEKTQRERIAARNGKASLEAFESWWIPLENKYISHFEIEKKCDITLKIGENN